VARGNREERPRCLWQVKNEVEIPEGRSQEQGNPILCSNFAQETPNAFVKMQRAAEWRCGFLVWQFNFN
jgi:hypothetical protein